MKLRKLISSAAALSIAMSSFAGLAVVSASAEDTENIYNFSDLTEEYARSKEASVFDGAVKLYSADEKLSPLSLSASITSPAGTSVNVTSALKAKKLKTTVHLAAGETVIEYYCGTDSGGSAAKNLDMVVQNSAGTTVATESNAEQSGGLKPYTIAYTAETEGDYSIIDTQTTSNRSLVYAIITTTAEYDASQTTAPTPTTSAATSDPNVTPTPTPTPKPTVDPNAKSEVKITREAGWLESAYITWTNPVAVDGYNVYVKPEGGSYTKLDAELTRYYGSYYRADALGLAAGNYQMAVGAIVGGAEQALVESGTLNVRPYVREGFAFDPQSSHYNREGVGAYKNDGTLKDGAKVLYLTDANKNTVKFDVVTDTGKNTVTSCTGLGEILSAREKNKAETTPLAIRMIGQVDAPADVNSSKYMQIKATSNVTFEGVGDDATTYHWSFLVRDTNNIEIRNLAVMEFYDDGISLDTDNFNDWVHNCDIFYGQNRGGDQKKGDGSLDVKSGSDYCSFSYNHFWDSGKTSLCGMTADNNKGYHMTYFGNWFDHSDSRHPRVRGDQVHVYNNYYDGVSKYGAGACTGSSVYVEKNVFRNTKWPVLTSQQGSDIAGGAKGTFSGEAGGSIKMYDNAIYGGNSLVYASESNTSDYDAYLAKTRDEQVSSTYTALKGGATYSNFDTASTMYSYNALDTDKVVDTVQLYAGRVQGGDFTHEFNDAVDDELYDRDQILGDALQSHKETLKSEYATVSEYPATEGTQPDEKATAEPFDPSAQPTAKPGGGSSSSDSTTVIWRASDNAASIAADTVLKADWLTLVGLGVEYKASNQSIGGVSFTGKVNAPSGQQSPSLGENGQNGATLKFTPDKDGKIGVYYKLNNGKTFYITDSDTNIITSYENTTGANGYFYISADVTAGKTYYAFGGGTNAEYWAAEYTVESEYDDPADDDPEETTAPDTTDDPGETTAPTATAQATTGPTPTAPAQTSAPSGDKVIVGNGVDFSADDIAADTYTATVSLKNFHIGAGDGTDKNGKQNQQIVVDGSNKTFGTKSYSQRIKLSGKATPDTKIRVIYFTPDADCTMTLNAATSNNTDNRNITVKHGSSTEAITLIAGNVDSNTVALKANEEVMIYSEEGAFNVYGIVLSTSGATETTEPTPTATAQATTKPTPTAPAATTVPGTVVKIVATYENGRLTGVTTSSVSTTEADAALSDAEAKTFYWNSLESLEPYTAQAAEETNPPAEETEPPVSDDPTTPPEGNDEPTITVGTGVTWNADNFEQGTYTSDIVKDGLTIGANDEVDETDPTKYLGHIVIDDQGAKVIDGATYTNRIKTGGAGDTATGVRCFSFVPDVASTVVLVAASSSGSAARTVEIVQEGNVVSTLTVSDRGTYTASGIAAKSRVYIYSTVGGLNVYAITVKPDDGSGEVNPTNPPSGETTGTVAVGSGITWLASDLAAATYTSTFSLNGLNIGASADKTVSVDTNNKTFGGVKYTSRIKPGGKGDPNTKIRTLYFTPDSDCTMTVNALTGAGSSATEKDRTYVVKHGDKSETFTVNDNPVSQTVSLKANEEVIIYPDVSAVNFYSIILSK